MKPVNSHQIILAIDYGAKRTGFAVGQTLTRTATPLTTLHHRWHKPDWSAADKIIHHWQPDLIVVGQPSAGAWSATSAVNRHISKFIDLLHKRYDIECQSIDESYTSELARHRLRNLRQTGLLKKRVQLGDTDSGAAVAILDHWFARMSEPVCRINGPNYERSL